MLVKQIHVAQLHHVKMRQVHLRVDAILVLMVMEHIVQVKYLFLFEQCGRIFLHLSGPTKQGCFSRQLNVQIFEAFY